MPGLHSIALLVLARASPATCQDPPATLAPPAQEQETALPLTDEGERRWTDAEDGWFDLSDFLEQPHGFLPLVIPITEPALGYGAVGSAVFLRPLEEAGAEGWA